MNKNLLFSSFISISFHALLLFVPLHAIFTNDIDIDIIKAPASIEISLVHPAPSIEVKAQKIEKVQLTKDAEKKENLQEVEPKEEKKKVLKFIKKEEDRVDSKSMVGAITNQISTFMINKPPAYPVLARLRGWEGEVTLIANINESGEVAQANILKSSGFYILDRAAVKAIQKWRFRNVAKPIEVEIPVKFVLTDND